MKAHTDSLDFRTNGKGTYEITDEVGRIVRDSGVTTGIATLKSVFQNRLGCDTIACYEL